MNLSLDEYRALVAKAFRGVGYEWGLTEDAAWAARRLAEFDAASPAMVLALLEAMDAEPPLSSHMPLADWTTDGAALCPIMVGTSLSDLAGFPGASRMDRRKLTLSTTWAPILIAPFLMRLSARASEGIEYSATWDGGACTAAEAELRIEGESVLTARSVRIVESEPESSVVQNSGDRPHRLSRVDLDPTVLKGLERLAHRVYAPATDASRDGAGAGTTDND